MQLSVGVNNSLKQTLDLLEAAFSLRAVRVRREFRKLDRVPAVCLFNFCITSRPREHWRKFMASGKVKWFDMKKGFGFIAQETGKDVFVHHTSIKGDGFKSLQQGEPVQFEIIEGEKGPKAQNVQRAGA